MFTAGWNVSEGQLNAIDEGTQVAAFDQGWKRAEWNQPENGGAAAQNAGATTESVGGTDDSSAAAAVP